MNKIADPFISLIIYLILFYGLNAQIYLKFSEWFFVPSGLSYGIFGFSFPICVAILYLFARKYSINVKSYLIRGKKELIAITIGLFCLLVISGVEYFIGFRSVDPSFLELFNPKQPYFLFNMTFAVILAPLLQQTFFLGFFFEILRRNWPLMPSAVTTIFAIVLAYYSGMGTIVQLSLFIFTQLAFILTYIRGCLGSVIFVNSLLNIYLYYYAKAF